MKIGSAWTKDKDGQTYLPVVLDEAILEMFPALKACNISLSFIKQEDRKSENSPSWSISLSKRKKGITEAPANNGANFL